MALQNEIAGCLVDLSVRLESNMHAKKAITRLCSMSLLDNPIKFMNAPVSPGQRAFQSVLQAMAFVTCEFSDELEDTITFERFSKSALVVRCLKNDNTNIQSYFDENFLISLVHLALKTWLASPSEIKSAHKDPFSIFDKVLIPHKEGTSQNINTL